MRVSIAIIISLGVFWGCTEQDSTSSQMAEAELFDLKGAAFTELSPDPGFRIGSYRTVNNLGDVTVDNHGNVYVIDAFKKRIVGFNTSGREIASAGGLGRDPGDFQNPAELIVVGDTLYAFDGTLNRIYGFSLPGLELQSSTELDITQKITTDSLQTGIPNSMEVMADGTFLISYQVTSSPENQRLYYYRVHTSGEIISSEILSFNGKGLYVDNTQTNTVIMELPYEREMLLAVDSRENIYTVFTERLLIEVLDAGGNKKTSYYYPFENARLNKSDLIESTDDVFERRALRGASTPDTWPAVADFLVDDEGRIWVAAITNDIEKYTWYVMRPGGEPVVTFELSRWLEIKDIRDDYVYVKRFNSRGYSDEIIRYHFDF